MSIIPTHCFTSPLRYPGGKCGLVNFIKSVIEQNNIFDGHYVEGFAGGAGIAWPLLFEEYVQFVHINDLDIAIFSFWESILNQTEDICRLINDTKVSMAEWYRQKDIQNNHHGHSILEIGFSTFFLNRTNRSGIIKGGVIGGKSQSGKWKLDARYNKIDLISRIKRIARYKSRISIYRLDGQRFIQNILPKLPKNTLVYLDPPYYNKGKELYINHFKHDDHVSLAKTVQERIMQPWIVSYDAVPNILNLYKERREFSYNLSYSAQSRYSGSEIMFFSDNITIPDINHPLISHRNN